MRVLEFKDNYAHQNKGINVTCRLGDEFADLKTGERIVLQDMDTPASRCAVVNSTWSGPLKDMPEFIIILEHDPALRDREAIRKAMEKYFHEEVTLDSVVTAISYTPLADIEPED